MGGLCRKEMNNIIWKAKAVQYNTLVGGDMFKSKQGWNEKLIKLELHICCIQITCETIS